jgi:uncharacterized membrane protein YkvA (DUF1232 family)
MFGKLARVFHLLRDPRVGGLPRAAVIAAVVYLISPVDLVPELLTPLFGFFDDATLLWLSMRWLLKRDPDAPRVGAGGPR